MKIIPISTARPEPETIKIAAACIRAGGIVVFPSDTCYGLAADPANPVAMEKLYRIKGRSADKAVSCIFPSIEAIEQWAEITPSIEKVLETHFPGPFTFLLKPKAAYPLLKPDALVGARIPNHPFTQALAEAVGHYTATSANHSGEPAAYSVEEMLAQLDKSALPDLAVDASVLPIVESSTVVDLTVSPPAIVRQGIGVFKIQK